MPSGSTLATRVFASRLQRHALRPCACGVIAGSVRWKKRSRSRRPPRRRIHASPLACRSAPRRDRSRSGAGTRRPVEDQPVAVCDPQTPRAPQDALGVEDPGKEALAPVVAWRERPADELADRCDASLGPTCGSPAWLAAAATDGEREARRSSTPASSEVVAARAAAPRSRRARGGTDVRRRSVRPSARRYETSRCARRRGSGRRGSRAGSRSTRRGRGEAAGAEQLVVAR